MEDDPEYDIAFAGLVPSPLRSTDNLRRAAEATLARHGIRTAHLSIALVDDARMARLHERHLGHQGSTDVLTFDLGNGSNGNAGSDHNTVIDGEIVVSVDTAIREAEARGHSVDAELALYVVHGTLHLLGYDDGDDGAAARMHRIEDEILVQIGLGVVYGATVR